MTFENFYESLQILKIYLLLLAFKIKEKRNPTLNICKTKKSLLGLLLCVDDIDFLKMDILFVTEYLDISFGIPMACLLIFFFFASVSLVKITFSVCFVMVLHFL